MAFWHWGHNDGFRAYTITYPDRDFGVVWFINSDNGMLILENLLQLAVGGQQPATAWLDYEQYDSDRLSKSQRKALKKHRRQRRAA